jgi:branched-chain amino acid transport system ATP-binding protein
MTAASTAASADGGQSEGRHTLEVKDLHVAYGAATVLAGVDMRVSSGEVVAVLGRNGAGKTTLLRAISGLVAPNHGQILLDGVELSKRPAAKRIRAGLAHVPQGRRIVPGLTVRENLLLGGYCIKGQKALRQRVTEVCELVGIPQAWSDRGGVTLSGGEQQLLAIGRALMAPINTILLDEPLTGLSPAVADRVLGVVSTLRERLAVLLVEQNAQLAMSIADRVYVLNVGSVVLGAPTGETTLGAVQAAYLGGAHEQEAPMTGAVPASRDAGWDL